MTATDQIVHAFEKAGLGQAPFRFLGAERRVGPVTLADGSQSGAPGQPMGTCDFCGTGIAICCSVESSDGQEFIVGSDCVEKVGDAGLVNLTKRALRELARDRDEARVRAAKKSLDANPILRKLLSDEPHPSEWRRSMGESLLDSFLYRFKFSGLSGRLRLVREINRRFGTKL